MNFVITNFLQIVNQSERVEARSLALCALHCIAQQRLNLEQSCYSVPGDVDAMSLQTQFERTVSCLQTQMFQRGGCPNKSRYTASYGISKCSNQMAVPTYPGTRQIVVYYQAISTYPGIRQVYQNVPKCSSEMTDPTNPDTRQVMTYQNVPARWLSQDIQSSVVEPHSMACRTATSLYSCGVPLSHCGVSCSVQRKHDTFGATCANTAAPVDPRTIPHGAKLSVTSSGSARRSYDCSPTNIRVSRSRRLKRFDLWVDLWLDELVSLQHSPV
ncbi:hypothetical protein RRG08_021266 [Elysia crispata]|uniref:Uncharacterized protein n=1 Tax=Elysia crispata TaxID=231223 RepID=A0AAE1D4I5_9GAST|nr:hypothetical protein RRG08_021266 [Elysia crispata]